MPPVLSMIKSVSAPRHRTQPTKKAPLVPTQQRKEKLVALQAKQQQIDEAISEWVTYTLAKAEHLGKRFNKKPHYFLDMFFQSGVRMVTHKNKTNVFNTFKSLKVTKFNEGMQFL
jgi:hypothetical protein